MNNPHSHTWDIEEKITDIDTISRTVERERLRSARIVFTNGCFDLLHPGHIRILRESRKQGDCLIVGLNSDDSVKRLKGPARPVQSENDRAIVLAALLFVDYIVIFHEDTPLELIKKIQPDVLVKGSDYKIEDIVGADIVLSAGGEVRTVGLLPGHSTSSTIEKMS